MTTKEKRLLRIALVIFMGYMLPFQLIPTVWKFYRDYQASIEDLTQQTAREEELGKKADYWKAENQRAKQEQEKIEAGLLAGRTRELVGARMQGLVKQLAQEAGITFRTLEPPDTTFNSGEWVLVIQSMQFEANSGTLMAFLQALEKAIENLKVVSLEVRSYQDRLNGTIKVTGFSRISTPIEEEVPPPASPPPNPTEQSATPPKPNEVAPALPAPSSSLPTPSPQKPEQLTTTPPEPQTPSQPEDLSLSPEEAMLLEEEDLSSVPPEEDIPPEEMNRE